MRKIDTSEWKEFKLGYIMVGNKKQGHGLFEIVNSVAYHGKDVTETDSDDGINYITRSKFNNGLKARVVRLDKFKVNPAGTISFGAENADFFYQTEPYITGNKMYYIDTTALSERACRFLKSIMEATFTANYSFSDGMIPARIYDECIKLPATPDGAPDWAYMESYMASLETKVAESLTMLQAAKDAEKKKVDTREWGEFRVGELFEVKISKSVDKGGLEFAKDGEYDFIGRTPLNNGIQGRLNKLKFEANQEGTYSIAQIGMHVCQYRERKWYASQNIFILTPFAEKSHKANKFIATVITRYLDCAYGEDTYATYPTAKTLPHLKIKLPVDKTGQPDWAYMEEYMRKVEERVKVMIGKYEMTVNKVAL